MKNIKRLLIIILAFCTAVSFTGCAKQRSAYVCNAVYVYDDSQEVNEYVEETETTEQEFSEDGMIDETEEQDIQEETEAETAENEENATQPSIENEQETEATTEAAPTIIDDNAPSEEETQTESPTEPPTQEETDEQRDPEEDPVEDKHSEEETGETNPAETGENETDDEGTEGETETTSNETPGDTPEDYPDETAEDVTQQDTEQQTETETESETESPSVEEQETETGNDDGSGEENPTEDSTEQQGGEIPTKEETTQLPPETETETETTTLSAEKIVGLECKGDLGTYIWGEIPDLSGIEVSIIYEDGHKEPTLNYSIDMNYPLLSYDVITPDTLTAEDLIQLDFERVRTYEPGTYIATVSVQDYQIYVEYNLIVVYGLVSSSHFATCKDPIGHNAVYHKDGTVFCDHPDECFDVVIKADGKKSWTVGVNLFYPMVLYYDYVLTEDEIIYDPFFWSKWPGIEDATFSGFPAYYSKNSGKCISEGEYYSYEGKGRFLLYDYARIKAISEK